MKAWVIGFEWDFDNGNIAFAREQFEDGECGRIVAFKTREEAEAWVKDGRNIDDSCFDIAYIELELTKKDEEVVIW